MRTLGSWLVAIAALAPAAAQADHPRYAVTILEPLGVGARDPGHTGSVSDEPGTE